MAMIVATRPRSVGNSLRARDFWARFGMAMSRWVMALDLPPPISTILFWRS
jgi:hypothetical protein